MAREPLRINPESESGLAGVRNAFELDFGQSQRTAGMGEDHGQTKRQKHVDEGRILQGAFDLFEVASLTEHKRAHLRLIVAGEPGQIGIHQDVLAVLMVAARTDHAAGFVQHGGPLQQLAAVVRLLIVGVESYEELVGKRGHAGGLLLVDARALDERCDRTVTRVALFLSAEHVVEKSHAQRTGSRAHFLDLEGVEHSRENGQAAGDHFAAVFFETREVDLAYVACFNELFAHDLQESRRNDAVGQARGVTDVGDGADRAGAAVGGVQLRKENS